MPTQQADLKQGLPDYEFVGVGRDDGKSGGEFSSLAVNRASFRIASWGNFWLSQTPDRPSKGWDASYIRDRHVGASRRAARAVTGFWRSTPISTMTARSRAVKAHG